MASTSWQRATKFREHLSFISTDHRPNNNAHLKSQFSVSSVSTSPPPEDPEPPVRPVQIVNTPPPIKSNWAKSGSAVDIERGVPERESNRRPWKSRFSFWRSTSAHPDHSPLSPIVLRQWDHLNVPYRVPPRQEKHAHKEQKSSGRCWIIILIIIIIFLLGNSVFLNIRVLNVQPPTPTTTVSPTPTSTAAPTSTSVSQQVLDCLSQFKLNAGNNPTSYPCSSCAPVLGGIPNDLIPSVKNPPVTGQGNVLQFCALSDLVAATSNNTLQNVGWLKDTKFCSWSGLSCDSAGRVNSMTLVFPGVPATLPGTLSSLIGLQTLSITGDSNIPSGQVQTGVLSLPSLQSITLQSTGLTGPMPDNLFSTSSNLTTLTLASNGKLGQSLPSSLFNLSLSSLIVTSQSLTMSLAPISSSPTLSNSLHTLSLSTNSITGSIPSLNSFNNLVELHLDNNQLTSIPSSFPPRSRHLRWKGTMA
ncbi:uncharacterized protein EI90DRAFT_3123480 [Cantharellus anzutake]|uniref:uncharacterized protein n=1 Tax=Cantharellus anzutake TaxID=1750568 RepID=UPI001908F1BB|nr:uncharacterized protein EI90DRAFT_3123480 [Cantharellus anzutake]KAF8331324.1 hypothetical protein EI90DRAFT_3123480 [Cantharellus anzutake]